MSTSESRWRLDFGFCGIITEKKKREKKAVDGRASFLARQACRRKDCQFFSTVVINYSNCHPYCISSAESSDARLEDVHADWKHGGFSKQGLNIGVSDRYRCSSL